MSVIDKIDRILDEAVVPSQSKIRSVISKGLEDVSDITSIVSNGLWHYFDLKIVKGGKVFKSQNQSSKKLVDELWYRIGKSVEKSERLTPEALKKLKKNFYSFSKDLEKNYNFDGNKWEFK